MMAEKDAAALRMSGLLGLVFGFVSIFVPLCLYVAALTTPFPMYILMALLGGAMGGGAFTVASSQSRGTQIVGTLVGLFMFIYLAERFLHIMQMSLEQGGMLLSDTVATGDALTRFIAVVLALFAMYAVIPFLFARKRRASAH